MIRRPPRSTLDRSSAASDVYKRQAHERRNQRLFLDRARHYTNQQTPDHVYRERPPRKCSARHIEHPATHSVTTQRSHCTRESDPDPRLHRAHHRHIEDLQQKTPAQHLCTGVISRKPRRFRRTPSPCFSKFLKG